MAAHPMEFIVKHKVPFMVAGGLVVVYLIVKNMSSPAATTTVSAPADTAQIAYQAQQSHDAALAAGAAAQQAFQLNYLNEQGTIQTQQQANSINGQLGLATIQANAQNVQTAAQLTLGQAETAAQVQMSQILANENTTIAGLNNQTQQVVSGNNTQVALAQTGVLSQEAGAQATSSLMSGAGGLLSLAGSFFGL